MNDPLDDMLNELKAKEIRFTQRRPFEDWMLEHNADQQLRVPISGSSEPLGEMPVAHGEITQFYGDLLDEGEGDFTVIITGNVVWGTWEE